MELPHFDSQQIVAARGLRNEVDPFRPYAMLLEEECGPARTIDQVATIFLTNRECPFRCLMCDLWQNTTETSVPAGAVPKQIAFGLDHFGIPRMPVSPAVDEMVSEVRMPPQPASLTTEAPGGNQATSPVRHIKLYNSGNFFDAQAITPRDHASIATLVGTFQTVIVENHPRLCNAQCGEFQRRIGTQLEVAMGLETIHPRILPALNKQMTTDDFARACDCLLAADIRIRAFVLLRAPGMSRLEGVEWALRSVEFAFAHGVDCCAVIPTRAGNGVMEQLAKHGLFAPPTLADMEETLEAGIALAKGRVFVDLWDAARFAECATCAPARIDRLRRMNLRQSLLDPVLCTECS